MAVVVSSDDNVKPLKTGATATGRRGVWCGGEGRGGGKGGEGKVV